MIAAVFLITLLQSTGELLAHGSYEAAIRQARAAFDAHERAGAHADAAWDLNDIGLANQYLGRYDAALDAYERALALDRASGSGNGEIMRLNNIGGIFFLLGRYSEAQARYDEAWRTFDARTSGSERGRLRKMMLSNMAALAQRLGADERALDWYARIGAGEAMQPAEEAQLLVNRGALLRRLGDPVKALDLYRQAQQLFARAAHRDGEIGAWRNIGIANALDLHEPSRALDAFDAALRLARLSANRRGIVQALLYRGESLRRAGRAEEADRDLREALDVAAASGLIEEQWKALYSIGMLRRDAGHRAAARASLERAVAAIESVRADIRTVALRSEFLADKRDVYDALIWLRANDSPVEPADMFALLERSRARTWQDRVSPATPSPALGAVQAALPPDAALVEYWIGADGILAMVITRDAARVTVRPITSADAAVLAELSDSVARPDGDWRPASIRAGELLLSSVADDARLRALTIAPDGPIQFVPFEALTLPRSRTLAVERFAITYVPSAALLTRARPASRGWRWPWQRGFVAFADPAPAAYPIEARPMPPLPFARDEVRRAAREVGGASEIHAGADATKAFLRGDRLRDVPVVHFATHAVADTRDPDRSRVLLAPRPPARDADYLFLREIYDLDLSRVSLVTLSACDTARGKIVRGEGVEAFGRALVAAGAGSALTTLWPIADRPAAELMTQFYYHAGRGEPEAEALRLAQLRFLRSGAWAHPYFWAPYLLTGPADAGLPRVVSWWWLAAAGLTLATAIGLALRAAARA